MRANFLHIHYKYVAEYATLSPKKQKSRNSLETPTRPQYPPVMDSFTKATSLIQGAIHQGVVEFVVCAGARNAALVEALAQAEQKGLVKIWRHFEERSAAFFALGRCIAGHPCAVVTTSGTAVAELLPALIEAYYQKRPLLAITADRPNGFSGTGAPQAIEQEGIFGIYAPTGCVMDWQCDRPWHCNISLDESFHIQPITWVSAETTTPVVKNRLDVAALARWLREEHENGTVVLLGGLEPDEQETVWNFLQDLAAPVLADATSGLREALGGLQLPDGDRLLRLSPPGKVLRIGDVPTGRFWRDLENSPQIDIWSITRTGFPGLARPSQVLYAPIARAVKALGQPEPLTDPSEILEKTARRAALRDDLLEAFPESEAAWVRAISLYASTGKSMFLGNSMPIREWNLFAQDLRPVTNVRANRGANGIDGQLSTWLGWTADEDGAWTLVGDLTTLYDLAAPFILDQLVRQDRVIVVINNGGGKIFDRLPQLGEMQEKARQLMTNPHTTELAGWAQMWNMNYLAVRGLDDLDALTPGDNCTVCEIFPDASQTADFWNRWDRIS